MLEGKKWYTTLKDFGVFGKHLNFGLGIIEMTITSMKQTTIVKDNIGIKSLEIGG